MLTISRMVTAVLPMFRAEFITTRRSRVLIVLAQEPLVLKVTDILAALTAFVLPWPLPKIRRAARLSSTS